MGALLGVLLLGLVGCAPVAAPPSPSSSPSPTPSSSPSGHSPLQVGLGQEFTLAPGQTARVRAAGMEVRFEEVKDDSRCPTDVQCVWEGDATVVVTVRGREGARSFDLHATSGAREARYGGYRLGLLKLAPPRRSTKPVQPGEYRATLSVATAPR